jgi:methyl-accepting chemotaxis protein
MSSGVQQVSEISKEISIYAGNAEQVSKGATEAANGVRAMFISTVAISDKSISVAQSMEEMASMINTIALAASEVAQGTQAIIKSIQEADAATTDTAGKASQTSESAHYLGEMANRLNDLVESFKV